MKPSTATPGHRCTLPAALRLASSDTHLPPVLPGTSLFARLVRHLRTLLLVSPHHPETRNHYRSRTQLAAENERLVRTLPPFAVHPFSAFRRCWETLIYCALTLHLHLLAFAFAFAPHLDRAVLHGLQLLDVGLCGTLGLEFALKLVTGFVAEGEVVLEPGRIVRHRLRWWNVANRLLLVVPYVLLLDELVRAFYADQALLYLCLVVYLYLLCVWRFRAVGVYFRTVATGVLGLSARQLRFIEPALDTAYVLHWTACLVYIVPLLTVALLGGEGTAHPDASFLVDVLWAHDQRGDALHYPIEHRARLQVADFRAFLHENPPPDPTDCRSFLAARLDDAEHRVTVAYRYLRALMITLKISLQGGHSLSVGHHFLHEWLQSLLLLAGWIWSTYVLLLLIRTLTSAAASDTQYDETLNEIDAFCRTQHLPAPLHHKAARHFAAHYHRAHHFDERPVLRHAPDNLRRALRTEIAGRALLARADVFRELPPYLLEDVAARLRFELFLEGDPIVAGAGTGPDAGSMLFLATGTAAVYGPDGTELGHLVDGANFGAIALFRAGVRRAVSVVALEVCEVYRLRRADFLQMMKPHTYLLAQLAKQADRRIDDAAARPDEDRLFDPFFY